jgi:anti-sigma-K factor RskA
VTPATGPDHARWADSTGAYVLGALAPEEADGFALHLAGCPACRAEVDELAVAVAALPESVAPAPAPPELRERLMADVRREASLLAAAGGAADRAPAPRRPRRERWWAGWRVPALAAAALLVGLVAGLGAAGVLGGGPRTVPVAAEGAAAGAHARLVLDDGHAVLEADHLPPPPGGRVYQVWIKPHGAPPQPTPALFVPRADGSTSVAVPGDAAGAEAVMVTAEPPGGSAAPTSPPVLTATVS